jgi:hypothetical protein
MGFELCGIVCYAHLLAHEFTNTTSMTDCRIAQKDWYSRCAKSVYFMDDMIETH